MADKCFSCDQDISEKARFCGKCGANVRCRSCGEGLHTGDIACEICGTRVALQQEQQLQNNAVNHIIYSDAKKGINLEAKITDNFGANAAAIVGMIGGRQMQFPVPARAAKSIPGQGEIFESAELVSDPEATINSPSLPLGQISAPIALSSSTSGVTLSSLFEERDGEWFFTNPNLKPKNKSEFFKRATCLYLQMQYDRGNRTVPREEIKRFLDNYSAYDGNVRKWLSEEHTLMRVTANDLSIIFPGTQFVAEILAEINDDAIPNTWKVGTVRKSVRKGGGKKDSGQLEEEQE